MPAGRLDVLIEGTGDDPRRIVLRAGDPGYARYIEAVPAEFATEAALAAEAAAEGRPMTGRPLLAIDTSGTRALVALGSPDGAVIDERRWLAGYRHGEELLTRTDELLTTNHVALASWAGSSSGQGPGRSPACAWGSRPPRRSLAGWTFRSPASPTSEALLAAAAKWRVWRSRRRWPAAAGRALGPRSGSRGRATLLRGGEEPDLDAATLLVAVDLPDRAPAEAMALGVGAEERLSTALLALGAARVAAGGDDVARLVPEYVTLPRGIGAVKGEVRWSHDRQ